jgi:hypothetical protein
MHPYKIILCNTSTTTLICSRLVNNNKLGHVCWGHYSVRLAKSRITVAIQAITQSRAIASEAERPQNIHVNVKENIDFQSLSSNILNTYPIIHKYQISPLHPDFPMQASTECWLKFCLLKSGPDDGNRNFECNVENREQENEGTRYYYDSWRDYRIPDCSVDCHSQLKCLRY